MGKGRASFLVMFLVGGLVLSGAEAKAWQFRAATSTTISYLYYSQLGNNGFFGKHNKDASVGGVTPGPGDLANANSWLGTGLGIATGSDAATSSVSTTIFPEFRAYEALSVIGAYRAGTSSPDTYPGTTVAFSNGEWLQWFLVLETPWGAISYGKRPFGFGNGLQFDSSSRTAEFLALVSDWGPLQIGLGFYPSRQPLEFNQFSYAASPVLLRTYGNPNDKSGRPLADVFGFVNFQTGPLEAGFGCLYTKQHLGPEGFGVAENRLNLAPLDIDTTEGWVFIKYFNGRFFFNAEADWIYRTGRFQRSATGNFYQPATLLAPDITPEPGDGSGSLFRPQYTESWRYAVESGFLAGPLKLSFLYAFIPGPDRRHGVLIDRQPALVNLYTPLLPFGNSVINHPDHSNSGWLRTYSTIMCTDYGAGVGARNRNGEGYMVDASILAARLDYALAANLNLFGTFFYANRVSHGYGWGFIRPTYYSADGAIPVAQFARIRNYLSPVPAIPDNSLGWEIMAGLNWNILDSCIVGITGSFWQPGKWFNYACIDRSVPAWNDRAIGAGNSWGVNPDRVIDPVFGLNCSISCNF